MSRGFLNKSENEVWDFLGDLAKKTLQWETTRNESLGARINSKKGWIHEMVNVIYSDTRFATLENMLMGFVLFQASTNFPLPK